MTIQNEFYNYQANPVGLEPGRRDAPNANTQMRDYLVQRWGGMDLGGYGERSIREGTSLSTHAFDAARDWRYENPGPGLNVLDTEIVPFLISTSKETGLQAIHHYRRCIIWRPPGTSGRPVGGDGWKVQTSQKSGMGQAWALWIHLEFLPEAMSDPRSIEEKIGGGTIITPLPPAAPIIAPPLTTPVLKPGAKTVINVTVTTVRRGSVGSPVKRLQALLAANFGQTVTVDGNYGPQTSAAVLNVQRFFGLVADDICGPKTWEIILSLPVD